MKSIKTSSCSPIKPSSEAASARRLFSAPFSIFLPLADVDVVFWPLNEKNRMFPSVEEAKKDWGTIGWQFD
jgi:hypothetical protein